MAVEFGSMKQVQVLEVAHHHGPDVLWNVKEVQVALTHMCWLNRAT